MFGKNASSSITKQQLALASSSQTLNLCMSVNAIVNLYFVYILEFFNEELFYNYYLEYDVYDINVNDA